MVEQLTLNQRVTGSSPVRVRNSVIGGGEVSELADEHDLGSCAFGRRSSSLLIPTNGELDLRLTGSGPKV